MKTGRRLRLPARIWAIAFSMIANAMAADPVPSNGGMLLLHYRWKHDSLALVDSRRVPAAVKKSRLSAKTAPGREARLNQGPPTGFAFELLDAGGKRISGRFLPDPGTRRVEYQEKGEHVLRSQVESADSADVFLRVPEADARTIRFYRYRAPGAGAASGASVQGPETAPARSLIAEFALP